MENFIFCAGFFPDFDGVIASSMYSNVYFSQGSFIWYITYAIFSRKTNMSYPLIRTHADIIG